MEEPAEKKGMPAGCTFAIVASAVGLLTCVLCGGVGSLIMSSNPTAQRVFEIGVASAEFVTDAQYQPGSQELRQAGCVQIFVITPELVERLAITVTPDAGGRERPLTHLTILTCVVPAGTALTCESIADTYTTATEDFSDVGVAVQNLGGVDRICEGVYTSGGEHVRTLDDVEYAYSRVGTGGNPPL